MILKTLNILALRLRTSTAVKIRHLILLIKSSGDKQETSYQIYIQIEYLCYRFVLLQLFKMMFTFVRDSGDTHERHKDRYSILNNVDLANASCIFFKCAASENVVKM